MFPAHLVHIIVKWNESYYFQTASTPVMLLHRLAIPGTVLKLMAAMLVNLPSIPIGNMVCFPVAVFKGFCLNRLKLFQAGILCCVQTARFMVWVFARQG